MKKRVFAAILAVMMILPVISMIAVYAEEDHAVGYSNPAICLNAGDTADLTKYSVQFEYGADAVSGVTWKAGGKTVTSFTPEKKGVYELSAETDGRSKTVYVVAKEASETEYVLYENDFSSAPDMSQFRVIHQPSGTEFGYDEAEGAIYLDSTRNTSDMIRVLLPEFLDNFGDAVYSADIKITKQLNEKRWCSLVYRQQNAKTTKLPYLQVVSRYNNALDNGLEIAERTSDDAWSVTKKGKGPGIKGGEYFNITADFCGGNVTNSINGKVYLTEKFAPYTDGAMGLQANGSRMTVSRIKITVNPESKLKDKSEMLHDTRDPQSNIVLAPSLVTEVKTGGEFAALDSTLPAVAIFDGELRNGAIGVNIEGKFTKLSELALNNKIIPAIRLDSLEEAESFSKYADSLKTCDMYAISSDMFLIEAARSKCSSVYGMVEMPEYEGDIEELRSDLVECGARGVIFTGGFASREDVSYLQDRYLVVWQKTDGKDISSVKAINNGVFGIVTPDVKATEACYTEYYNKNTLIRTPEIIGHRGIPSKAQENSLSGAIEAIANGATMVECDVYLMRDGNVVVMHDATIDRTTNGSGKTVDQTVETLKKYKIDSFTGAPAEPIPMLEDLLASFKASRDVLVIELKSSDTNLCREVVELIKKYGMEKQCVIIAFSTDMIQAVRTADPGISVNYLTSSITANEQMSLEVAKQILHYVIQMNTAYSPSQGAGTLGPNLYADLAARGVTVWNWTVNNKDQFNKFFVSGIRGITTNYSDWAGGYIEDFFIEFGEGSEIKPKAVNYKGGNVAASNAELVVIGGSGEYKDGVLTLSEEAEGFFFRLKKTLSDGTQYSVVTPAVLASELKGEEIPANTTAEETEETVPADTTDPIVVTPSCGGDEPVGGCGSIISIPVLALVVLGITVIKKRK